MQLLSSPHGPYGLGRESSSIASASKRQPFISFEHHVISGDEDIESVSYPISQSKLPPAIELMHPLQEISTQNLLLDYGCKLSHIMRVHEPERQPKRERQSIFQNISNY